MSEQRKTGTSRANRMFSISGMPVSQRQVFASLAKDEQVTQATLFSAMLNNYKNLRIEFNDAESNLMQEAHEIAPKSLDKRIRKVVLRYAEETIDSKYKPGDEVNIKIKNSAKAADARADAILDQIFQHNEDAVSKFDKILLTKTSILYYALKQKQIDPEAISLGKLIIERCLERNKELIALHHEEHKLTPNHNAMAYYERLKATRGNQA